MAAGLGVVQAIKAGFYRIAGIDTGARHFAVGGDEKFLFDMKEA
jgi:hypothetical protein